MAYRPRRAQLTDLEKKEIWRQWRKGQALREIAEGLGSNHTTVRQVISATGGFPPVERKRSPRSLSLAEREEISRGVARGEPTSVVARRIGRAPSTVTRELHRNGGSTAYRAADADGRAWARACRPKTCVLASNTRLRLIVAAKLRDDWSPEQIAGWLITEYPDDDQMRLSHETIYRSLFIQARGVLKKELIAHLRTKRSTRRPKHSTKRGQGRGKIVDAVSIRERPAEAQDRAVPGHWEGDLISGAHNSFIATLVERHSRYVMLVRVENKTTQAVVPALSRSMKTLPEQLRSTLTWDRGLELAAHKDFTVATDVAVYFCDPRSPWQRGSNENTNGLLRQYLPRDDDFSRHSQTELDHIAHRLNSRPRKTLGFATPAAKLSASIASTG